MRATPQEGLFCQQDRGRVGRAQLWKRATSLKTQSISSSVAAQGNPQTVVRFCESGDYGLVAATLRKVLPSAFCGLAPFALDGRCVFREDDPVVALDVGQIRPLFRGYESWNDKYYYVAVCPQHGDVEVWDIRDDVPRLPYACIRFKQWITIELRERPKA